MVPDARDAIRGPHAFAVLADRYGQDQGIDAPGGGRDIVSVTLTVPPSSGALALFQHVTIKQSAGGEPLLPILWSDNDVTLWPGESLTLTAQVATRGAAAPVLEVSGWNVPTQSVQVAVESRTAASQEENH